MHTESLTNREWLPGELLSGSERQRPSWFLDMNDLLVMHTESLTNREWLPGELLSGSERQRPSWFLDMNDLLH